MKNKNRETVLNLCVSIFYSKTEWHRIALEAVYPFLNQTKNISSYMVCMNCDRGDNIRLILKVEEKHARNVASLCNTYFKDYLDKAPSTINSTSNTGEHLFMNFENNTIQYGIFKFQNYQGLINPNEYNIALTDLLMELFLEEKDQVVETTFELSLKMLLIYFNVITGKNNKKIIQLAEDILKENKQNYNREIIEDDYKKAQIIFDENHSALIDFTQDYLTVRFEDHEYGWEKKWHNLIEIYCKKFNNSYTQIKFFEAVFSPVYQLLNIKHGNVILNVLLQSVRKNYY